MKKLTILTGILACSAPAAFAQTFFQPDFTTGTNAGTAPLTYTAGSPYTETTSGGETVTYSAVNDTMTTGDFSTSGGTAYISSTLADPNSSVVHTQFTFTPNYTATSGGQANITIFSLGTTGGNNDLLDISFQPFGYSGSTNINLYGGVQFGGSTTVNNYSYSSSGLNSLNGVALTFNLVTTTTQNGPGLTNATITTTGTISDSAGVLYNYDVSKTGNTVNGNFDPANNPLTATVGITYDDNGNGLVNPGATFTYSNVLVTGQFVPEPSTYALMFCGLGALALLARRRRSSV